MNYDAFVRSIKFWGRVTLFCALILSFAPAAYLFFSYGLTPDVESLLKAVAIISSIMVVSWLVEPISYFPILGLSGTYMSWLAGNISNLRLPVSAITQHRLNVEHGTPEGDVVSTIGIAVSVIVNLAVVFVFALAGAMIIERLPESVISAFDYILPSVFGALTMLFSMKKPLLSLVVISLAVGMTVLGVSSVIILIICIFGTIAFGIVMQLKNGQPESASGRMENKA
ncbi:hypothetical protein [Marinobacterium rhizophilum]|uniref:Uncharacterized protein n=1 Tax=Marinobacterium rhizophilum TaxID=420402 RepID=A0ABY5HQK7_9GAMM|nr:hypothetical protein [Marinobacterium rhizophilum]UTW13460.1 hypothetical protein KDW95_07390 [Marinobacterium rhizophilum]